MTGFPMTPGQAVVLAQGQQNIVEQAYAEQERRYWQLMGQGYTVETYTHALCRCGGRRVYTHYVHSDGRELSDGICPECGHQD